MKPGCLNPLKWRGARILLPWKGRSLPLGCVLLFAVLAAVAALAVAPAVQMRTCAACHDKDAAYAMWKVSGHKDVSCGGCHVAPASQRFFRTRLGSARIIARHAARAKNDAIQASVPDANCRACHKTTREWVVYHGIKISHQKHWDRNIPCAYCHKGVVHGPDAAAINVPTMAMCTTCHDGKQAPNDCSLCHEVLKGRKPAAFSKEWKEGHKAEVGKKPEECLRCHQASYCENCHKTVNPHEPSFIDVHAAEQKRNPKGCELCHPGGLKNNTCARCHSKEKVHPPGYREKHGTDVASKGEASCRACHKQQFCTGCHKTNQPHPPGWGKTHARTAGKDIARCQTCHTLKFCESCHNNQEPENHKALDWERAHGKAVSSQCQTCHKQQFCNTCHQKAAPRSHKTDWTRRHGPVSLAAQERCLTCHTARQCSDCHGMQMPHPSNYRKAHITPGRTPRLCTKCHSQKYCDDCHKGSRPATHNASGWAAQGHGKDARKNKASCLRCHQERYCQACHTSARPASHKAKDFLTTHGSAARQSCATCHTSSKFCDDCHKTKKPPSHGATWLAVHGKSAASGKSNCAYCHARPDCTKCHSTGGIKPSNHNDAYLMGHAKEAKDNQHSCALCHTADMCNGCHKPMSKPEIKF